MILTNRFAVLGLSTVLSLGTALAPAALGAAKSYQVTGKIIQLTDSVITVDKAGEKFEINREAGQKIEGKLAVGQKVTVTYHMVADSIKSK